jgi:serine/threonine-protein kinase
MRPAQQLEGRHGNLQPGAVLGSYQLLCAIARGGMGQVWAARRIGRLGVSQLVAIKTALPQTEMQRDVVEELFFDEARVAASIDHPNVCRVYELGDEQGVMFLAMEWIYGGSLINLMAALPSGRLDCRLAAYIVAQACSGLHAAHELVDEEGVPLDVVHRDATPQNILVSATGEVKVVDFGVVKSRDQVHQATVAGEVKGKISYVAPEQLRSGIVDRRTDVFALGAVLYYLTTGARAFTADSAGATMIRILEGEYTIPSRVITDFPAALEVIISRALANDRDERYSSAEEMQNALETFIAETGQPLGRNELASVVMEYLGPTIEQRRADIRNAQKYFDGQSSSSQMRVAAPVGAMAGSGPYLLRSPTPPAAGQDSSLPPAFTGDNAAPLSPLGGQYRSPIRRGIGYALLAITAIGAGVVWNGARTAPPSAPEAAAPSAEIAPGEQTPQPAQELPQNVVIDVRATPDGTRLSIDDGPAVKTPYQIVTRADGREHLLRLEAKGHTTITQMLSFDRDRTLTFALQQQASEQIQDAARDSPQQPSRRATSSRSVPVRPTPSDAEAAPPKAQPAETRTPETRTPETRAPEARDPFSRRLERERPHHAIDPNDPFSE